MLDELIRKLRDSFEFPEDDIRLVTEDFIQFGECVEIEGIVDSVEADSTDNKFLECALVGNATAVVSGDKHLLNLKTFQDIPILLPADFLRTFQPNG